MKRIIRDGYITAEQASKYDSIREKIEKEKPEIDARIRAKIGELRRAAFHVVKLDESQARFTTAVADRIRLLAPAGSGKTQSLLWRCDAILGGAGNGSQRCLVFTFTRAARDELVARINGDPEFTKLRGAVRVDTLNRWGWSYLRGQASGLVVKSNKSEIYFLVNNVLRPLWGDSTLFTKALGTKRNRYTDLMDVISTLKTCGFRHDRDDLFAHARDHINWLGECGLARFFEVKVVDALDNIGLLKKADDIVDRMGPFLKFWVKACNLMWSSATLTLDDQKYWALLKLQEKYATSYFPEPNRYHHIFVDEFQDVNPLDIALVRELVRVNKSSLTIVGDDDQAIFEWRGATPAFILDPNKHLGGSFESHTLEINYRCPKNIVQFSQSLIGNNDNRVPKAIRANRTDDAIVNVITVESHDAAIDHILELAKAAHEGKKPKSLAVLARKKSQLLPLEVMLTSEEIPFYAKEDLNVLLGNAFDELKTVLIAVATQNQALPAYQIFPNSLSAAIKSPYFH